jgi:hypothetical protein
MSFEAHEIVPVLQSVGADPDHHEVILSVLERRGLKSRAHLVTMIDTYASPVGPGRAFSLAVDRHQVHERVESLFAVDAMLREHHDDPNDD